MNAPRTTRLHCFEEGDHVAPHHLAPVSVAVSLTKERLNLAFFFHRTMIAFFQIKKTKTEQNGCGAVSPQETNIARKIRV